MQKILQAAALAVVVASVVAPVWARGPKTLVVREGLTEAELEVDSETCLKEAKAAERGEPIAPLPAGASHASQMAGAATAGMIKGFNDMERFMAAHDACLARLGYRQVELTKEQRKEFGKIKDPDARGAYIVEFSRQAIAAGK